MERDLQVRAWACMGLHVDPHGGAWPCMAAQWTCITLRGPILMRVSPSAPACRFNVINENNFGIEIKDDVSVACGTPLIGAAHADVS